MGGIAEHNAKNIWRNHGNIYMKYCFHNDNQYYAWYHAASKNIETNMVICFTGLWKDDNFLKQIAIELQNLTCGISMLTWDWTFYVITMRREGSALDKRKII